MTKELVALAARNNAEWCDTICRANGQGGRFYEGVWLNPHGTPRFYPDAVTLARNDAGNGIVTLVSDAVALESERPWAVKDSFAELDLTALNFSPLFEARWIYRDPLLETRNQHDAEVLIARTEAELAAWSKAWAGSDTPIDSIPFKPVLLRDPAVRFVLVEQSGIPLGGGILSSSPDVVGLSNVFASAGFSDIVWQALIACAARSSPFSPLVGYERGSDLDAACRNGFQTIGDLQVWVRPA